jgi:hypothetical protein
MPHTQEIDNGTPTNEVNGLSTLTAIDGRTLTLITMTTAAVITARIPHKTVALWIAMLVLHATDGKRTEADGRRTGAGGRRTRAGGMTEIEIIFAGEDTILEGRLGGIESPNLSKILIPLPTVAQMAETRRTLGGERRRRSRVISRGVGRKPDRAPAQNQAGITQSRQNMQ